MITSNLDHINDFLNLLNMPRYFRYNNTSQTTITGSETSSSALAASSIRTGSEIR